MASKKLTALFAAKDKVSKQLENMNKKSHSLESGFKKLAKTAAVAFGTKVVVDFGKKAVTTFMDFEQQMAKVHSITGANDEQFKQLTDTARELGRTTIFSATEVAKAQEFMGMA